MTHRIHDTLRQRDVLNHRALESKSKTDRAIYKVQRNKCTSYISPAKRIFHTESARDDSIKFWKKVKQSTGMGKLKSVQHPWPCRTKAIIEASADNVNQHFVATVTNLVKTNTVNFTHSDYPTNDFQLPPFSFTAVSEAEVAKALSTLKSSSSTGSDNITSIKLKLSSCALSSVLTKLFNISLTSGVFPTAWKTGVITPICKKGCKFNINNYRLILVLSVISRLFERLLSCQLHDFLEINNVLSAQLYGFRPFRYCQTAHISLTNRLFTARGNGLYSAVVSIDYSKTFDCLNHELLLQKLRHIGATDNTVSWFRFYLPGRQQRVKYNNFLSDPLPVSSGIPQSSVFAPQLYNIYVNDLLLQLPAEVCVACADDINLIGTYKTAENTRNTVQQLVNIVANLSHINCLSLNTAKCNIMYISPKVRQKKTVTIQPIMLNGNELSIAERMTILGVIIPNYLSWTAQARKVQAVNSKHLNVLHRLGAVLNFRTRLQLYNAFITSRLLYCLPVRSNCPMTCQHAIDRILKCARFVLNFNEAELTRNVFNITNICSLSHCVSTVFKSINLDKIDDFSSFKLRACVSQRTTRVTESNKAEAPIVCRKCDDYCFLSAGPASWNILNNTITSCKNFSNFKNSVFTYTSSLMN